MTKKTVSGGVSVFCVLASIMSWTLNKSVLWAFIHFFCGFFYVAYACCARTEDLNAAVEKASSP